MESETTAVHGGTGVDPATGAIISPIYLATTFERQPDGNYPLGYEYSRQGNPNRDAFENALCSLEKGTRAIAFSSGSAAMMSMLLALSPKDHILAPADMYFGNRQMLREIFGRWGLKATFLDMTKVGNIEKAVRSNTRLIIIETPSNPLLKITDIKTVSDIAQMAGAYLVCDNTIATPILQKVLDLGADFSIHATTKYLGGHGDVMGGVVIGRKENEFAQRIKMVQKVCGPIPSPFECWLALRGIQTLPQRIRAQAETGLAIARYLANHPRIEKVHYPGLADHPGHKIAQRQMSAYGGLLSALVIGGRDQAMAVAARVKLFTRATSFGGTHSLIEHRASVEEPGTKTPQNLLRLSIGLENADDLIADLEQALGT